MNQTKENWEKVRIELSQLKKKKENQLQNIIEDMMWEEYKNVIQQK